MALIEGMLEFIKQREKSNYLDSIATQYPKIQKVLEVKMKDYDDDNGPMGKHYVVKCKITICTNSSTSLHGIVFQEVETTCLVDVREFNRFMNKENAIIWL
jgi:hypothetical protein